MSNDLISRNEVMKLIESKFVDGCLEEGDKTLIDGYGLLDDVSDMPTAYDINKVVERLEEKLLFHEEHLEETGWAEDKGCIESYEYAIEIVKSAALNENGERMVSKK